MPAPLVIAAGIGAGGALGGAGLNFWQQQQTNRKSREFSQDMYNRQRQDSLNDWLMQNAYNEKMWGRQNEYNEGLWNKQNEYNEMLWNKQNAYNSPMAQMQRFKEAGLNPNLIYGQSNTGGSISTATLQSDRQGSANIRSSNAPAWNPRAPQFDLQNGLMAYMSLREQAARTNNLESQNKVLEQDAILRATQTANIASNTAKTDFELGLASELRATSVDAAKASLRKMEVETDLALQKNERDIAMNASNLREAAHRIANMRGQQINQELDAELKRLDIALKQMGVQPGDNIFLRGLGQFLNNLDFNPIKWGAQKFGDLLKD